MPNTAANSQTALIHAAALSAYRTSLVTFCPSIASSDSTSATFLGAYGNICGT